MAKSNLAREIRDEVAPERGNLTGQSDGDESAGSNCFTCRNRAVRISQLYAGCAGSACQYRKFPWLSVLL